MQNDVFFMQEAILEAQKALAKDEVPVGAVLVKNGEIIGRGHNRVITENDCSAHAEIMALRDAGNQQQNYRLPQTTLYVTLEPCVMCAGSLVHARIQRLVFAALDPKTGVVSSQDQILEREYNNHQIEISSGVLEAECSQMLKDFFRQKRNSKKTST